MSPRIGLDLTTLLSTASELADTHGFENVTLALLAQKLKIRPPSLYNHVRGLPELRRLLAHRGLETLAQYLDREVVGQSGDDAIRAYCRTCLIFARTHPGLYEAIQRAPSPDDELLQQAGSKVLGQIYRTMTGYGIEGEAAIHAVRAMRSLIHGFVMLEKQGAFGMPIDPDDTFHYMVTTFLAGIKAVKKEEGMS